MSSRALVLLALLTLLGGCDPPPLGLRVIVFPDHAVAEPRVGASGDERTWRVRLNGQEMTSFAWQDGSNEQRMHHPVPLAPDGVYRWEVEVGAGVLRREQHVPTARMSLPTVSSVRVGDPLRFSWPHVERVYDLRASSFSDDPDAACIDTTVARSGSDDAVATVVAPTCVHEPPRTEPFPGATTLFFAVDVADGDDTSFVLEEGIPMRLER